MKLSEPSLDCLRDMHERVQTVDGLSGLDLVDSSCSMGLMAHTTPAWIEPYVAILDQLIEGHPDLTTHDASDHAARLLLALRGIRSMIDTSLNRRSDRSQVAPGREASAHIEIAEVVRWPAGEASRVAAEAAGGDAWERLLAAPLEMCPQVVGVDLANMALDRAEWIGGNLHLGLRPKVEDSTRSTSFRVVGAEPRIWDLHGIENARMESTMSGLNVGVPMVKADVTLIRSSY